MLIPERFEEKLTQDKSLRRSVDDAAVEFEPWLRESKLPFFPDYTNHGAEHVEGILITASSLINDEAWAAVTAADAAVLILSTLLHDCAMHLNEEGFQALVSGAAHTKRIQGFGDAPWPELWQEFLFSAKRFDDRALIDLFGKPIAVRTPPTDRGEMTLNDRLLIGEFVRRHHPRLAHEIAVGGVPGPTDNPIRLSAQLDGKLADIAGLVARSHGLPLRATFDYLNTHYHRREYKGVHAVFLMAVLRVADYLQIQAERAPRQMLQVKDIRSPFSRREWRAHHSVDNVVTYEDDPEAILVQATPPDVRTYLRLKEWLGGIQEELDSSWAVLGEVYGPVEKLRRLGLVIRRVRSNLDDERAFSRLVEYVPRRVEFDIAHSEILKLLVRPLYGARPEIGIRELLQNSVDAVRELWDLQEQNPMLRSADLIEQEADVVMWLDEPDEMGVATFTITDRGVGMTEEVIIDYFLKVGASYRHSDAWAKQHERVAEEADAVGSSDAPRSRVLRSGRFGIGALAAFLLGDEVEVVTRHVTAERGIRFTTRLESEAIELRYDAALKVGTTIRIPVSSRLYSRLADSYEVREWDWYCLTKPSVVRLLGSGRQQLPQRLTVPGQNDLLPRRWHRLNEQEYSAVHYSYRTTDEDFAHALICNGILVGYEMLRLRKMVGEVLACAEPWISIFDPDGKLPLDLTRTRVGELAGLKNRLNDARINDLLAFLITNAPSSFSPTGDPITRFVSVDYSAGLYQYPANLYPWFYTPEGISIIEPWNILRAGVQRCLVRVRDALPSSGFYERPLRHDACLLLKDNSSSRNQAKEPLLETLSRGFRATPFSSSFNSFSQAGSRILTTKSFAAGLLKKSLHGYQAFGYGETLLREEWSDDLWVLLVSGSPPPTLFDLTGLGEPPTAELFRDPPVVAEWFLDSTHEPLPNPKGISARWEEIIREPVIPYDPKERRRKLAHAYKVLAPHIEKLEAAAKKWEPQRGGGRRQKS